MTTVPFRLPRLGQSMTEASVVEWVAQAGQSVEAGETILVIETDKTEFDLEAPTAGRLGPHLVGPGDVCEVGALLVELTTDGDDTAEQTPAEVPAGANGAGLSLHPPLPPVTASPLGRGVVPAADGRGAGRAFASPKAKAIAKALGVELSGVTGTGPKGLILAADVEVHGAAAAGETTPAGLAGPTGSRRHPLTATQRAAATNLVVSWTTAPHFVQMFEVDFSRLVELRSQWRAKGGPLASVNWNDIVVAAFARTLARFPLLNARLDGQELVLHDSVSVGIAVETRRGLLVPVVDHAHQLRLTELSARLRAIAETGRGDPGPSVGTVSNLGRWGIRQGTPVLNQGELMLLFVGEIGSRPAVEDGVVLSKVMSTFSIAFDHRGVDGAEAARFCAALRHRLEQPDEYL